MRNNQIAHIEYDISIPRIALFVVAGLLCIGLALYGVDRLQAAEPYAQSVLSLDGRADRGREIFQMNCAGCHGSEADGFVGPTLHGVSSRKSAPKLIEQVTSGKTPPMPQFQPEPQEMADLLAYLQKL